MTDAVQRLRHIAINECLPYLLALPRLAPHTGRLSLLLVGSVATGLCGESSDLDIAIVCDQEVYDVIGAGTPWAAGRPSEEEIAGVQLHYYAITFDAIESKLRELDDVTHYVYGNAVALWDPEDRYLRQVAWLAEHAVPIRRERIEGKLDMLFRRAHGLDQQLAVGDPLGLANVCLELITRCLKLAGLLDNVVFDPRKRLFATATVGAIGREVEPSLRQMLASIGELAPMRTPSDFATFIFPSTLQEVLTVLAEECRRQGFRIGLEAPDRRQTRA